MSQTFTIDTEAGVQDIEKHLQNHAYLSGKSTPGEIDAKILGGLKDAPDRAKHPNFFAWWWSLALFQEAARALWGKEPHKKEGKKEGEGKTAEASHPKSATTEASKPETHKTETPKTEAPKTEAPKAAEDELDLFGDDSEADKAALEEMKKKKAEEEEAKKNKKTEKKGVIAKSSVLFDVKAYEETFDFVKLGKEIKEKIIMDGLVWQQNFKILPVAYAIKKLQCGMIIEDDKVSADDVLEQIQNLWPDDIQSCDIVEFNKV